MWSSVFDTIYYAMVRFESFNFGFILVIRPPQLEVPPFLSPLIALSVVLDALNPLLLKFLRNS